jgi:predicted Zn-dependent protease
MRAAFRCIALLALAASIWPEIGRYRAEWMLAQASGRLERVLRYADQSPRAGAAVEQAEALARRSARLLPGDARPPLLLGIALILQGRAADAIDVLETAIAQGERPELTLNLGRARSSLGDEAGANAAYLRAAWASPDAIATLPAAMRASLLEQVESLESELRAGRLAHPPPLP